jgi:hypothetical protein
MGVAGVEPAVKKGGHPFERPHGRGRVKEFDAHQVDFPASERFRAPEYFSDIEGGFEVIQNQDTGMTPGAGQFVPVPVPAEPPLGRGPFRLHHQSYFMGSGHELFPGGFFS